MAAAPRQRASKMRFGFTSYQWGSDWDIAAMIENCAQAKAFAVELRTSSNYAHGVETSLSAPQRREIRKRFAGSPVTLIGIASGERFDWPDPAKLDAAIESAKAHLKLSHDVGSRGVRVFPNDFHTDVPREKTIGQISRALNVVGKYAADLGQMVRLENHGTAGDLVTLRRIMDGIDQRNVRVKLNGHAGDAEDFARRFEMIRPVLGDTLHMHELDRGNFPYQLQTDLLIDAGWEGWCLLEASGKPPDRLQALIEQRRIWEQMIAKSLRRT
jgi:sugar phosphate isomerase/epimerase